MAGIKLDFKSADIWYASVQKCFGLPAGLGILICSPQALQQSESINERNHYNSLPFLSDMMTKWQTPFTPNVLGIYLLMRTLENSPDIDDVQEIIMDRFQKWVAFLAGSPTLKHLISNEEVRSYTVLPVTTTGELAEIKNLAKQNGLLLGEGYGEWKSSSFRIANFPALREKEIKTLMNFLKKF
jgi:phosphoserine aminotransferase